MTTETVIRGSRAKAGLLLAVSLGFTAIGVWLLGRPGMADSFMPWLVLLFFGLCTLVAAALVVRPGEVRLKPDGFTVTTLWRSFHVPWDDVESFHVWRNPRAAQTLPAWTYKPGRKPKGVLAEASANLGAEGGMPGMLTMSTDQVVALMNHHLELRRR